MKIYVVTKETKHKLVPIQRIYFQSQQDDTSAGTVLTGGEKGGRIDNNI